jgi:hypothetical protein
VKGHPPVSDLSKDTDSFETSLTHTASVDEEYSDAPMAIADDAS